MDGLFICNSYYHILIATIKVLQDKGNKKYDLILSDDNCMFDFENIKSKLEKEKIFRKIYIELFPKKLTKCNQTSFGLIKKNIYILFNRIPKKYIKNQYKKMYIFNDTSIIGRLINKKKIKYILLEDGTDTFKNNKKYMMEHNKKKHILKRIFNIKELGESDNIEYIEVNDKNGVNLDKKVIVNSKKSMFNSLNNDDIIKLQNIFLDKLDINKINNKILIITQPLYEDGFLDTNIDQLEIYDSIIKKFGYKYEQIVFKKHPREITDYEKKFCDSIIIKQNFPIELLNFFPKLHFKTIITISSTAIELFDNCDEKIVLGWDWLDDNYKRKCNSEK